MPNFVWFQWKEMKVDKGMNTNDNDMHIIHNLYFKSNFYLSKAFLPYSLKKYFSKYINCLKKSYFFLESQRNGSSVNQLRLYLCLVQPSSG